MNILESILYGILSGVSRFLPISSSGHQQLFKYIMGVTTPTPIADLFIHIALLLALIFSNSTYLERLNRERISKSGNSRTTKRIDVAASYDNRLLQTATISLIVLFFVLSFLHDHFTKIAPLALCFLLNGIALYFPEHLPHGDKDSRKMSTLDSLIIGLSGALSILPGLSCVGFCLTAAVCRGADKSKAIGWVFVISIPAILCCIVLDFITMFTAGVGVVSFVIIIGYILSALFAFVFAIIGISVLRYIISRSDFTGLAFYSWGAAILCFILYLTA